MMLQHRISCSPGTRWLPSLQSALTTAGYNRDSRVGHILSGQAKISPFNAFGSIKNVFLNAYKGINSPHPNRFISFPAMHWRNSPARPTRKSWLCGHFPGRVSLPHPSWLSPLLPICCMTQRIPLTMQNHTQNRTMRILKFLLIKFKQRSKINPGLYRLKTKDF